MPTIALGAVWSALQPFFRKIGVGGCIAIALAVALFFQTTRIEGFKVWPIHIPGLKAQLAETKQQLADTKAAFAQTVANYRAAAEQARRDDAANKARVEAEQAKINQETSDAFEARIADARDRAGKLRQQLQAASDSRSRSATPVSGISAPAKGSAQGSGEDGFSVSDRLLATEQAIQLDELIKWVRKQAGVDVNGEKPKPASSTP